MIQAPSIALLVAGLVLPTPERQVAPEVSVAGHSERWVAKRKRRGKKSASAPASIKITTDLPQVELKIKKRKGSAILVEPGQQFELELTGPGKLAILVYQVLESGQKKATASVIVNPTLDGKPQKGVSFRGKRDKRTKVYGDKNPSVTKPKSATVKIASGKHTVAVKVPGASTAVIIELQYFPRGSKAFASLEVIAAPPEAPEESVVVAEAPAAPPPDAPLAPDGTVGDETIAATAVVDEASPWSMAEARVNSGEVRDALVGELPVISIQEADATGSQIFFRATTEQPFRLIADGPGTVTLRVHRLAAAGASSKVQLTITENDVFMQSVDLSPEISTRYSVPVEPSLQVASPNEYKFKLGPKMSRFELQPSETAVDGVALQYEFAPEEKAAAMALTLDLGDELGMGTDLGGGTIITEVAVRERIIEKVIRIGEERVEHVGIAIGLGAVIPTWGGIPAPSAAFELQWILPFAGRSIALTGEGQVQRHELLSRGSLNNASFRPRSLLWAIPARIGPTYRLDLSESTRLSFGVRGIFAYIMADSKALGGSASETATVLGAAGSMAFEIQVGAGWWTIDAGYSWTQAADLGDTVSGFSPSGVELVTRFRFVL